MEVQEIIERSCRHPEDFVRIGTLSSVELVGQSGLLENPDALTHEGVLNFLHQHPNLIDTWIQWSEDKRTGEGWYFLKKDGKCVVAKYPHGPKMIFDDPFQACSEYIIREVSEIAELAEKDQLLSGRQ